MCTNKAYNGPVSSFLEESFHRSQIMTKCIYREAHRHSQHLKTEKGSECSLSMSREESRRDLNDVRICSDRLCGADESLRLRGGRGGDISALHYDACIEKENFHSVVVLLISPVRSSLLQFRK